MTLDRSFEHRHLVADADVTANWLKPASLTARTPSTSSAWVPVKVRARMSSGVTSCLLLRAQEHQVAAVVGR